MKAGNRGIRANLGVVARVHCSQRQCVHCISRCDLRDGKAGNDDASESESSARRVFGVGCSIAEEAPDRRAGGTIPVNRGHGQQEERLGRGLNTVKGPKEKSEKREMMKLIAMVTLGITEHIAVVQVSAGS